MLGSAFAETTRRYGGRGYEDSAKAFATQCLDDAQEAEGVSYGESEDGRKCFPNDSGFRSSLVAYLRSSYALME